MFLEDLKEIFADSAVPETIKFKAKEFIFRSGVPVRGLFGVEAGKVRLERYTSEGKVAVMHIAGKNECFAEASLFSSNYNCYAVAEVDTSVVLFPREKVLETLSADPETAAKYIGLLSGQVRDLRTLLELRRILSARERILEYLTLRADPKTSEQIIPGNFKYLAAHLGLAHETLYRELKHLEEDGSIKRNERWIKIL